MSMAEGIAAAGGASGSGAGGLRARLAALPLHHRFALAGSLVSLIGMALIASYVSRSIETGVVRNSAISSAVYMESFIAPLSQELAEAERLAPTTIARLQALLAAPPLAGRVMGVKIWRRDGLVAFASDPALIGQSFVPGEELREAWAGELNASFDKLEDDENARERDAGVPLLEVYNPVHSIRSGEIIAVAEFYIRADELAADIRRAHAGAWAVVAGVSAATFLALFGIVRAGSRTIAAQTRALTGQLEELRRISAQNDALRQRVQAASRRGAETSERYMRRISAELHDGPAQALALASLRLDALMRRAAVAQDDPEARNLRAVLDEALGEVRALCRGLALPELEGRGLGETLEMAVGAHERRTGTAVARDFADSGMEARLPHPVLICLYRVVQEGLMNAWRHAPGAPVMVAATCRDGQLSVTVLDRGPGFDPAAAGGGLGLAGLRERAESLGGEFALDTAPGAGTRLAVALPQEALG